jgi:hypothetical protein
MDFGLKKNKSTTVDPKLTRLMPQKANRKGIIILFVSKRQNCVVDICLQNDIDCSK